jgi:hypothetical protein
VRDECCGLSGCAGIRRVNLEPVPGLLQSCTSPPWLAATCSTASASSATAPTGVFSSWLTLATKRPRSPPGELHPIHPTCPHPDAPRRRHPVRGQKDQSAPHPASCSVTPHRRPRQGRLTDPAIEQTISPLARTASPVPACTSSSSRGTREREISNSSCATAPTSPAAPSPWIQGPKIRRRTGSPRQSNAGTDRLLHRTPRLVNPELRICGFFPRI